MSPTTSSSRPIFASGAGIVAAAALAYAGTFSAPFVFDDVSAILENPTLLSFGAALFPPAGSTVSGRPLLNISFALNRAVSGEAVGSYHALNLTIHAVAGLLFFGLVRRSLLRPGLSGRFGPAALPLAWVIAALWTLHPLQTESVTYVVQRAESLMGLCYFATLYGFVRSLDSACAGVWRGLSIAACALGMLSKEVMVSAPVLVLLYDRTFVAGSFLGAWRQRRSFYVALALTWLPLALLVAGTGGNRGGSVGFGVALTPWDYWLTQFEALTRYLALSAWPHSLVFEYGPFLVGRMSEVVPFALLIVPLIGATVWSLHHAPAAGFLGLCFFAPLAPTSLLPGTTQMIVEHRMYLSLAAVIVAGVLPLHVALGRRGLLVGVASAALVGALTARRNTVYRTELALWADTVAHRPANALAHANLANALVRANRVAEALPHYETALRLAPGIPVTHHNFGLALARLDRPDSALAAFARATQLKPGFGPAHAEAGRLLLAGSRPAEAIVHFESALRANPADAATHASFATALFVTGRTEPSLMHYAASLRLRPDDPETHYDLGNSLFHLGRIANAASEFENALRWRPAFPEAHYNLALMLARLGRTAEAATALERALALRPDFTAAREELARVRSAR